jgi:hypothetical protein
VIIESFPKLWAVRDVCLPLLFTAKLFEFALFLLLQNLLVQDLRDHHTPNRRFLIFDLLQLEGLKVDIAAPITKIKSAFDRLLFYFEFTYFDCRRGLTSSKRLVPIECWRTDYLGNS